MTRTIDIPLANGMHPTGTDSRASKWFRLFSGLRITDHGAEPWPAMTAQALVLAYAQNTSWATLRKDGLVMRAQATGASPAASIYEGSDTKTTVYSPYEWVAQPVAPPAGVASPEQRVPVKWHMVDMGGAWFLFDGAGGVYFRSGHNPNLWYAKYGQKTGCVHDGRLVLGGFESSLNATTSAPHAYDYAAWHSYFDDHSDDLPVPYASLAVGAPGANWVWWSSVGADDALFWYNKTHLEDGILDLLTMGTSGLAVMPFTGSIVRILPLLGGIAVYGSNGACFLASVMDPTPGYAVQPLPGWPEGLGVISVDGDTGGHLAVTNNGAVWTIGPDGGATPQEFKYLFSGASPSVLKDPYLGGWFVGPDVYGEHNYFDRHGLVRVNQRPTSVFVTTNSWTGALPAATVVLDVITDTYPVTGGAVVAAVKLHGSWATDTYVSLLFRRNDAWVETASQLPDSRGLAVFNVPAHQFRVRVHGATLTGVKLERLEVFLDGLTADGNGNLRAIL
jgi:hypothetical protein